MSSLWRNSSGELIRDSGSLIRCATCPCGGGGAPTSCPCTSWPSTPTSGDFPCGGVEYTYTLTSYSYFLNDFLDYNGCDITPDDVFGVRLKAADAPLTLTATSTSCRWEGTATLEETFDGSTWSDYGSVTFFLELDPVNGWAVGWNDGADTDEVFLDNATPIGSYLYSTCIYDGIDTREDDGNAEVTA